MHVCDTLTRGLRTAKALLAVIGFGLEIKMRPNMSVRLFMSIWLCIFASQKGAEMICCQSFALWCCIVLLMG